MKGSLLTSLAAADQQCISHFGTGWRTAEWHDGRYVVGMGTAAFYGDTSNSPWPWIAGGQGSGGHAFFAYGNVRTDKRFWVHINDQPGNCWNP